MDDTIEDRIEALERTVADDDYNLSALSEDANARERLESVESEVETLESQIEQLEAATQALRGYVGNIRAVNQDVENRAETALAKAEAVEAVLDSDRSATGTTRVEPTNNRRNGTINTPRTGDLSTNGAAAQRSGEDRKESSSADGGVISSGESTGHRCHACGQPHSETNTDRSETGADRVGTGETTETVEEERDNRPLVPDESGETGTLQRISELL